MKCCDRARTEELWTGFSNRLRAYFRKRVRNPEDAEDLLHDTFTRLHVGAASVRAAEVLVPWLFRVAQNALIDHYRRKRERHDLPDLAADPGTSESLNRTVAGWLREFLPALPPLYREAIEATELGGSTQRELALRESISLSAVKSRVRRGRKLLMERLLDCCHVDFDRRGNVIAYTRRK